MKITKVDSISYKANVKLKKPDLKKLNKDVLTGSALTASGVGSFLLGLDSWGCGLDSGVIEKIYTPFDNCENFASKNQLETVTMSLVGNSSLIGPLVASEGIEKIVNAKKQDKKIPN